MTIHAVDKNFKLVEIPVEYRDRPAGSHSKLNTVSDGFKVLKTIATLFKEYKPVLFFNIIAFILFVFCGNVKSLIFLDCLDCISVLTSCEKDISLPELLTGGIFIDISVLYLQSVFGSL